MKNCFLVTLFLLVSLPSLSQVLDGKVQIEGFPNGRNLEESIPVDLFKSFKENKYKIKFSYKASDVGKRGLVLFHMKTTIMRDGKTIHQSSRENWPWLPGDMYVPIEAFDMITALQNVVYEMPVPRLDFPKLDTNLPKGTYSVKLEMIPVGGIKGKVTPAEFSFRIE